MLNSSIQSQLFTFGTSVPRTNAASSQKLTHVARQQTTQVQRHIALNTNTMRLQRSSVNAPVMTVQGMKSSSISMGFTSPAPARAPMPTMSSAVPKQAVAPPRAQVKMLASSSIPSSQGAARAKYGPGFGSSGLTPAQPSSLWASVNQARFSTRSSHSRRAPTTAVSMGLLDSLSGAVREMSPGGGDGSGKKYPILGEESIMSKKAHGTTETPVQSNLLYGCDFQTADRICCYNRHYAEHSGYAFQQPRTWIEQMQANGDKEVTYYDSVTGKPLFIAPRGRTTQQFLQEGSHHGWPSFRDEEVVWENVRCLRNGEAISVDGTHLGHNLPDFKGNRYCINLVSIAGNPVEGEVSAAATTSVATATAEETATKKMKFDGSESVQEMIDGSQVMMFSKSYCPFCLQAKQVLEQGQVKFSVIELDQVPNGQKLQDDLKGLTGQKTVPNVYVVGEHVGGCSELIRAVQENKFQEMLNKGGISHQL